MMYRDHAQPRRSPLVRWPWPGCSASATVAGRTVAVVMTGGNADFDLLAATVEQPG